MRKGQVGEEKKIEIIREQLQPPLGNRGCTIGATAGVGQDRSRRSITQKKDASGSRGERRSKVEVAMKTTSVS